MKFVRAALLFFIWLLTTSATMLPADPPPLFTSLLVPIYADLRDISAEPACHVCVTSVVLAPEIGGADDGISAPQSGLLSLLRRCDPKS